MPIKILIVFVLLPSVSNADMIRSLQTVSQNPTSAAHAQTYDEDISGVEQVSICGLDLRLHDMLYRSGTYRVFHNWWEYARRQKRRALIHLAAISYKAGADFFQGFLHSPVL